MDFIYFLNPNVCLSIQWPDAKFMTEKPLSALVCNAKMTSFSKHPPLARPEQISKFKTVRNWMPDLTNAGFVKQNSDFPLIN